MINIRLIGLSVFVQTADDLSRFVFFGITSACHNNAGTGLIAPFYIQSVQTLFPYRIHNIHDIRFQQRQHDLSLGISEAAVIFDDFCAVGSKHKPKIQTALKRSALRLHGGNGGLEYLLLALFLKILGISGVGSYRSHAARVKTLVVVIGALVIHRGYHGFYGFSVGKGEHRDFRTRHKFLHNYLAARFAELPVQQHRPYRRLSLGKILCDDNTLAKRQSIALDDRGIAVALLDISDSLVRVGKGLIGSCGDIVFFHQRL